MLEELRRKLNSNGIRSRPGSRRSTEPSGHGSSCGRRSGCRRGRPGHLSGARYHLLDQAKTALRPADSGHDSGPCCAANHPSKVLGRSWLGNRSPRACSRRCPRGDSSVRVRGSAADGLALPASWTTLISWKETKCAVDRGTQGCRVGCACRPDRPMADRLNAPVRAHPRTHSEAQVDPDRRLDA